MPRRAALAEIITDFRVARFSSASSAALVTAPSALSNDGPRRPTSLARFQVELKPLRNHRGFQRQTLDFRVSVVFPK